MNVGSLRNSDGVNRKPVLDKRLRLPGRNERKVRLIVCVNTRHQLDVRAIVVCQTAIPRIAEVVVAPGPLLLSWSDMVIGYMNDSTADSVIVSSKEIFLGAGDHVTGRNRDICIPTEIIGRIG